MTFYLQRRKNRANFWDIYSSFRFFFQQRKIASKYPLKIAVFRMAFGCYWCIGNRWPSTFPFFCSTICEPYSECEIVRFVCFNDCILQIGAIHTMHRLFILSCNIIFGNFVKLSVLPVKSATILCDYAGHIGVSTYLSSSPFFLFSSWVHLKRRTDQNTKSIVPTNISHSTVNAEGKALRLTRASHTAHFIVTTFQCCIIQVMPLFGCFQHIAPFTCGQLQIFNKKNCAVAFVRSLNQKWFFLQKLLPLVCPH